jgi:hypothetical protein
MLHFIIQIPVQTNVQVTTMEDHDAIAGLKALPFPKPLNVLMICARNMSETSFRS